MLQAIQNTTSSEEEYNYSQFTPLNQTVGTISLIHKYFYEEQELMKEISLVRKNIIFEEVLLDLKLLFPHKLQILIQKGHGKPFDVPRSKKVEEELTGKFGARGYKLFLELLEHYDNDPEQLQRDP